MMGKNNLLEYNITKSVESVSIDYNIILDVYTVAWPVSEEIKGWTRWGLLFVLQSAFSTT